MMNSIISDSQLRFRIDAHAVIQLGEELITDAEQALLELVKNAYDADSKWCKIDIDTQHVSDHPRIIRTLKSSSPSDPNFYPETGDVKTLPTELVTLKGSVTITDSGMGMTFEQIRDSWLVVSTSIKRAEDGHKKSLTPMGRTPVGDKGLGRLGTMRLGQLLRITTSVENSSVRHQVSIWLSDFKEGYLLNDVPISYLEIPNVDHRKGTTVEVLGLNNLAEWKSEARRKTIHAKLSTLINPYESQKNFPVGITYDGIDLDPLKFTSEILNLSSAKFTIDWVGAELVMTGKMRLSLWRGVSSEKKKETFNSLIESDKGKRFFDYLSKSKKLKSLGFTRDTDGFFISVSQKLAWSEIKIPNDCSGATDPGPFSGEVSYFLFNEILDSAAAVLSIPIRQYIKDAAGISIFKEGFQVRSNQDWLGLRESQTSGGSFYGLRPSNSIGFFEISGQTNPDLRETSNRENFIDNSTYRGFLTIARRFKQFADIALEECRREFNDFEKLSGKGGVLPKDAGRIGFEQLRGATESIASKEKELSRLAAQARNSVSKIKDALANPQMSIGGFASNEIETGAMNIAETVDALSNRIDELSSAALSNRLERSHALVESHVDDLNERNISLIESAAVGLSARWLAHDVRVFLDDISLAARRLGQLFGSTTANGDEVKRQLASIDSAAKSIDRVVGYINPLLPQRRARKETILLYEFIHEYFNIRQDLFIRSKIDITFINQRKRILKFNRGHLLQILDNLVQNSRYWLTHALEKNAIPDAKIFISISESGFDLWDNGLGVIETISESLFELFVTDKPRDEGRGIGLFIVKSLLEANSGSILLSEDRNKFGRRFKFSVDLSSAINLG